MSSPPLVSGVTVVNPLLDALIDAQVAATCRAAEWGQAIRDGRSATLLATLAARLEPLIPREQMPPQAAGNFLAVRNRIEQRNRSVIWECAQIRNSLAAIGVTPVLLKGAAYLVADLPLADHRSFGDLDVMVDLAAMPAAETQLMLSGWLSTTQDAYDQRYYRRWMHEIPPLQHLHRGTTLDLHHAIAPRTARYQARMDLLFDAAIPAANLDGVRVLSPPDMILHASTHLFAEGETPHALRNLVDIAELLSHFQRDPDFDATLAARAFEVGLARPMFYALRYLQRILRLEALDQLMAALAPASPGSRTLDFMDPLYDRIFRGHPSARQWPAHLLYLRGHWLRMPMHLLAVHLGRKLLRSAEPQQQA
jgi:hypothetical protein